jgi:hypothetical protein
MKRAPREVLILDFFELADVFQDPEADGRFDMNEDGLINLEDFFAFIELFSGEQRAKIIALSQEHLWLSLLNGNLPNPFNSQTLIRYRIGGSSTQIVHLTVYDITGRRVRQLADRSLERGEYNTAWDGRDDQGRSVASGVYFYQLQVGTQKQTQKMLLQK